MQVISAQYCCVVCGVLGIELRVAMMVAVMTKSWSSQKLWSPKARRCSSLRSPALDLPISTGPLLILGGLPGVVLYTWRGGANTWLYWRAQVQSKLSPSIARPQPQRVPIHYPESGNPLSWKDTVSRKSTMAKRRSTYNSHRNSTHLASNVTHTLSALSLLHFC